MRAALALVVAAAVLGSSPDAGTAPAAGPTPRNPVRVTADRLQVLNKRGQAVYTGHVVAIRGTTRIRCGRMVATYGKGQDITRIECLGGVEIDDRDRWARGEQAVYEAARGLLEVTGSPEARQGPNTMTGDRVLFDLDRDTIEVDRPRATFELSGSARAGRSRGAGDGGEDPRAP